MKIYKYFLLALVVIAIDQASKLLVHHNMFLHQEITVCNVIDSTFYGVLLNNHPANSPTPWFHGQVIDMLFFPLFDYTWPDWIPYVGGEYFLFFSPVFNIADSSIFLGVVIILIFQRRFFGEKLHHEEFPTTTDGVASAEPAPEKTTLDNQDNVKPPVSAPD
jgi:signal peptidase II